MKVDLDWRLNHGIASLTNFAFLLAVLLCFPLVLRWTGALSVADINPQSPQHTPAFLKFCFVLSAFLWVCFAIALVGIRRRGRITWQELVGAKRWPAIIADLGIALATLVTMAVIGNLSNAFLGPFQKDSAGFRSMVAQNNVEALAFLALALSAGFVRVCLPWLHTKAVSGPMWQYGCCFYSATDHFHARPFLPGFDPTGTRFSHRDRSDDRGSLAKESCPWNDRPWSWGWLRRLHFLFEACVTV